jgi:hypothetical protein
MSEETDLPGAPSQKSNGKRSKELVAKFSLARPFSYRRESPFIGGP